MPRWKRIAFGDVVSPSICPSCNTFIRNDVCTLCKYQPFITLDQYFGTHAQTEASELTLEIAANAADLLAKVNKMLVKVRVLMPEVEFKVNSGWRPEAYNRSIGGAPRSNHITGHAVDVNDPAGELGMFLKLHESYMEEAGLYAEALSHTKGWVHLQDIKPLSGNRFFNP